MFKKFERTNQPFYSIKIMLLVYFYEFQMIIKKLIRNFMI